MLARGLLFAVGILFAVFPNSSNAARILGLFSAPARSHSVVHEVLMLKLSQIGHDVTSITSFSAPAGAPANYRHIQIPFIDDRHEYFAKSLVDAAESAGSYLGIMKDFVTYLGDRNEYFIRHPIVQDFKKNETFDLLVLGWFVNDFQIGLAADFKCPVVLSVTIPPSVYSKSFVGNPIGASFIPAGFLNHKGYMNFWKRVQNLLAVSCEYAFQIVLDYYINEPYYARNFPSDKYPSLNEIKKEVSLVLVNNHFSTGSIEPSLPALVEVGGIQMKNDYSSLPKDLKEWLDGATEGAIYFSLGSNVKSSYLSPEKVNAILRVFAKLKQRIIFKYEDNLPNKPDNVLIGKWLPQSDILAHPNIKLFISHCGLGGVTEAQYNGIPILGIPIYGDQTINLNRILSEGWAIPVSLADLTEQSFEAAITEILTNSTYRDTVQKISHLYRDRPMSAIDTATYWVDYVIRHKGAKHMQSPAVHLNFFQYHSLDVIGFLLICIYISWKIEKISICFVFRKCCSKAVSKIDQKRKKE